MRDVAKDKAEGKAKGKGQDEEKEPVKWVPSCLLLVDKANRNDVCKICSFVPRVPANFSVQSSWAFY